MTALATNELVKSVVELVSARDYVSIAEIQRHLADRIPVKGDRVLGVSKANVEFAFGLSEELVEVMMAVQQDGRVVAMPSSLLVYLVDGCALPASMPMAKRVPKGGYKTPHFAPIVFRPAELPKRR